MIGYYEHTWYKSDNWGISQNEYQESNGDLVFWFRIWSNDKPSVIPPPIFLPDVKIQSVTLPSDAKVTSGLIFTAYYTTFRLTNNEPVDVTVHWQAHSSVTGDFDNGNVTVPKNSYIDVNKAYPYSTPGLVQVTYTVDHNGNQLNTWRGTMNVLASSSVTSVPATLPSVKIQSVTLPSNAKVSPGIVYTSYSTVLRLENSESIDVTVNWRAHSSLVGNFDSGSVTVSKNSYVYVNKAYRYLTPGKITLTYTISYGGVQLDSWTGTMKVAL